jgi:hypothetical protein
MLAMRIGVCSQEQFSLEQEVSAINSHSLPFEYDHLVGNPKFLLFRSAGHKLLLDGIVSAMAILRQQRPQSESRLFLSSRQTTDFGVVLFAKERP